MIQAVVGNFINSGGDCLWDNPDLIERLYVGEGLSKDDVGEVLGCSGMTIARRMESFGIESRSFGGKDKESPWREKDTLEELYCNQDLSQEEISEKLGCAQTNVGYHIRKYGIKKPYQDESLLADLYPQQDIYEISEKFDVHYNTIRDNLRKFDLLSDKYRECHNCGDCYNKLGDHWLNSECQFPDIDSRQKDILTGFLMGDASVVPQSGGETGKFTSEMVTLPFFEWLQEELGNIACPVRYVETDPHLKDKYSFNTVIHPLFIEFRDWYGDSGKLFPDDIDLTPLVAKVWYCCDGGLHWSGGNATPQFSAYNESENTQKVLSYFSDTDFDPTFPSTTVRIPQFQSDQFLDWMGDPLPGFQYKWENECRTHYDELRVD